MSEKKPIRCPWCGRDMDGKGKDDGHTWYRDDSDYIEGMKRRIEYLEKRLRDDAE